MSISPPAARRPPAAMNSTGLSIIVPAFNSARELRESLPALTRSMSPGDELLVVDDGSTDDTAAVAAAAGARVLALGRKSGPSTARNHGAHHAAGSILLFVDADVVVRPDVMARIRDAFAQEPRVAAIFGSYDATPRAAGLVSRYRNLLHHFVHQQGNPEAATFWAGLGAVRRGVFLDAGGFDAARFPEPAIEDIELGYRLRRAGHRILLDRDLQGTHLKSWTLVSMVRTDLMRRALPWGRLILERAVAAHDLNLKADQRWSACLLVVALVAGAAAPFLPALGAAAVAAILAIVVLNRRFYALLRRHGGLLFAVRAIPLHLLYFLYSGLAFAYVSIEARARRAAAALARAGGAVNC
jgi:glycosyltransferase involved in cell wall biosynthesis